MEHKKKLFSVFGMTLLAALLLKGVLSCGVAPVGDNNVTPPPLAAEIWWENLTSYPPLSAGAVERAAVLTFTFEKKIEGLTAKNFTFDPDDGLVKGEPTPSEDGMTWTMNVSGIPATPTKITLTVGKDDISFTPPARDWDVEKGTSTETVNGPAFKVTGEITNPEASDLMVKFGIKGTDYQMSSITSADVSAAFNSVHAYLQSGKISYNSFDIKTGDYIDLARLAVVAYNSEGAIFSVKNTSLEGDYGALLRLIVVGINSFRQGGAGADSDYATAPANGVDYTNINGNIWHLVFQFQNIPGTRRMEASDTTDNGYHGSEMRRYLVPFEDDPDSGKFLKGLELAGVPKDVLWAPKRYVTDKGNGASAAMEVEDLIWLPTSREIYDSSSGSNTTYENKYNQTKLEYYILNPERLYKYNAAGSTSYQWWLASPYSVDYFCWGPRKDIDMGRRTAETPKKGAASATAGVAPAFCVY
jgi:hypothetical protein